MKHFLQFIRFALVGAGGFLVDAGVLYLALYLGFGYFTGRAISFICALCATWLFNRYFTFTDRSEIPVATEAAKYFIAMSLGGAANYIAYSLVILEFNHTELLPLIAVAVGSIAGMFFNFFSAKLWVFRLIK
jgi:putative flippase GtrA